MQSLIVVLLLTLPSAAYGFDWQGLFATAEQRGQRAFEAGDYQRAAELFTDVERRATAWYRDGDFERAAAAFGRSPTAQAAFNRGNALVLLGRYEEAIASYQRSLAQRPDWREARENLELAQLRLARLAPPEDDYGGTGGQLEADEIAFDTSGRTADADGKEVIEAETGALSDDAMRALWLRRVDTRPRDFLQTRFAYQLATQRTDDQPPGSAPSATASESPRD